MADGAGQDENSVDGLVVGERGIEGLADGRRDGGAMREGGQSPQGRATVSDWTAARPAGDGAPAPKVLIVDDLLATGGTVAATIKLVEKLGGEVAGVSVLAELSDLHGRDAVGSYDISSLIVY